MKAYKGFDRNLQCRGYQYEVGKEYETDKAELCECGFHACEMPLKVWDYYPPSDGNRYCEVEQSGDVKSEGAGGKSVSTKLKVGAEIGIPGLIKAQVEWTREQVEKAKGEQGGDYATLAGGDDATLAGGNYAKLAGGNWAKLAGGDGATLAGGNYAKLAGGNYATLAGGDWAKLAGGDGAKLAGGKSSVCVGRHDSKVKGGLHSVLVLTAWETRDGEYIPTAVKAIVVDGEKYKPDTWYTLRDGEAVEVKDGEDN